MPSRVLIVCTGNLCRSPMAEAWLRHCLGGSASAVESAGLAAPTGEPIDPMAERVLRTRGLSAGSHLARRVDARMLGRADLVLAMERRHIAALLALDPALRERTFLLSRWQDEADIEDPHGGDESAFVAACDRIEAAVRAWLPHL